MPPSIIIIIIKWLEPFSVCLHLAENLKMKMPNTSLFLHFHKNTISHCDWYILTNFFIHVNAWCFFPDSLLFNKRAISWKLYRFKNKNKNGLFLLWLCYFFSFHKDFCCSVCFFSLDHCIELVCTHQPSMNLNQSVTVQIGTTVIRHVKYVKRGTTHSA